MNKEEKIEQSQDKGFRHLAEIIYSVWQDKQHCTTILDLLAHVVDNDFDLKTLFSEPVELNHILFKSSGFKCECGCNLFKELRDLADNHLVLKCTNCQLPHYF